MRPTLMMSMPSSVVSPDRRPAGVSPALAVSRAAPPERPPSSCSLVPIAYSTVTDLARLRGWSTSVPRATAV